MFIAYRGDLTVSAFFFSVGKDRRSLKAMAERVLMGRQKSDHLIVALKRVKARGAKGMTS